jgi:hypothetical protein
MNVPGSPRPSAGRRRRRFSLNALAIQVSAFALSFTLVALLVVSGSQEAFVETNQSVENYVPIGTTAPTTTVPRPPTTPRPPSTPRPPEPTPAPPTEEPLPPVEEPEELPDAEVLLTDNGAGTAMFNGPVLAPGGAVERCIAVTYSGNVDPGPVRLYAAMTYGDLAPLLDLTVEVGKDGPGTFGGCAGFVATGTLYSGTVAGFVASHPGYDTGRTAWDPWRDKEARIFRFTVTVQDIPAAAGKTATFGFSWETRAS